MSDLPHHAQDQWLSFELRMRQRRFVRCIERAETALNSGLLDDARSALEEARHLQKDGPELASLDERLATLSAMTSDVPEPEPQPVATIEPSSSSPATSTVRSRKPVVAIAAAVLALLGGGTIGALYWNQHQAASETAAPPALARPVEIQHVATAAATPVKPQAIDRLKVVYDTITARETVPRLQVAEPLLPSYPGPPIAAPEPQPQPEPVVLAVNRGETAPPETRAAPLIDPPAPPVAPIDSGRILEPPGRAIEPGAAPAATPAVRSTPPPAAEEAPVVVRDETVVRAVLRRYETAYSNLDANAASVIWPGVNRGALARAFDGLASQQVSLGSCDVTVIGPAARATCSGSATWQPKVGGGVRTEARRWSFDLRKNGEAWRIERAVAR
jgi:hypothetical protein